MKKNKLSYSKTVDSDYEGKIGDKFVFISHYKNTFSVFYYTENNFGKIKLFNRFSNGYLGNFKSIQDAVSHTESVLGYGNKSIIKNFINLFFLNLKTCIRNYIFV